MTEVANQPDTDGRDTAVGVSETSQHRAQDPNRLQLTTADSASDNDAGERPVREKLKKTSIASMPRNDPATNAFKTEVEQTSPTQPNELQELDSTDKQTPSPIIESRGRLSRKRSYDDIIDPDQVASGTPAAAQHGLEDVSHSRKRSRDVRAVQLPVTEPSAASIEEPLLEGESSDDVSFNYEIEGAQSPRKKRSRDEFDIDGHRGQKIPATDGARAYRRSEDSERGQLQKQDDKDETNANNRIHQNLDTSSKNPKVSQQNEPPEPGLLPPPSAARASSPQKDLKFTEAEPKAAQKPPGGFAASGFAAMSGSSKSPFGTFGASTPSVFGPNSTAATNDTVNKNPTDPQIPQPKKSAFNTSASPFLTSTTASSGKSGFGFGANGAAPKPSGFGGSVFGSAFTNTMAPAPKLSSFAAPTGNIAPSKPVENPKPFGAQADDSTEEDGGSDDEANPEEIGNGDIEVDSRFQQQEVETGEAGEKSIFQCPRAQLYYFDSGGWHEKGKGSFKLNVTDNDKEKQARFIMRAHQTYRVLLNQPIFKKMQVGDSKGREPPGKSVSFAVIDQGRPMPHLLKLSDENESKALYREVLKLQREMETQV